MTKRDDIIRMARTALRLSINDESLPAFDAEKTILDKYEFLCWFAKQVADAEREACVLAASIALLGADKSLADRVVNAIRARSEE
jgi:hypothetical protein